MGKGMGIFPDSENGNLHRSLSESWSSGKGDGPRILKIYQKTDPSDRSFSLFIRP